MAVHVCSLNEHDHEALKRGRSMLALLSSIKAFFRDPARHGEKQRNARQNRLRTSKNKLKAMKNRAKTHGRWPFSSLSSLFPRLRGHYQSLERLDGVLSFSEDGHSSEFRPRELSLELRRAFRGLKAA